MLYDLVVRSIHSEDVTVDHLAMRAEMHPAAVQRLIDFGLIRPVSPMNALLLFKPSNILRLRSIRRLRSDLGINLQGVAAVLDLLERLRDLENENASLRARL
jgi:MerR family transcriptional regulator/heat shock protein HspR